MLEMDTPTRTTYVCMRVCACKCECLCVSDNYDSRMHSLETDTYKHWSGSYPEKLHVSYAFCSCSAGEG